MQISLFLSPFTIDFTEIIVYAAWLMLYYFTANGFCVQFFYRYLVLNRSMTISFGQYSLILLLWALFCLPTALWILIGGDADDQVLPQNYREELAQMMTGSSNGTLQVVNSSKVKK
jgi:hypothetical protein